MLRSLESFRVEPQALGLQSNLKDEPCGQTAGKIPFESSWNWGLKYSGNSPFRPLSFYTEFRKILSTGIVIVIIIRMPLAQTSVDFKPLTKFAGAH